VQDLVRKLEKPRAIWPDGSARGGGRNHRGNRAYLEARDTLIDGGNSYYSTTLRAPANLLRKGIQYVDVGTAEAFGDSSGDTA